MIADSCMPGCGCQVGIMRVAFKSAESKDIVSQGGRPLSILQGSCKLNMHFSPNIIMPNWNTLGMKCICSQISHICELKYETCYGLKFVPSFPSLPVLYGEAQFPNSIVLGGGAFGKWLGLDEVLRMEPPWRDCNQRKRPELPLSAMWGPGEKVAVSKLGREPSLGA